MKKRLVVANWKMNFNIAQASVFMHRLEKLVAAKANTEVIICPSFIALQPLHKDINHKKFKLGAQNMHYADHGTFTGEVSGQMLNGLAEYVIVGHSERRYQFNEHDITIARKLAAAVRHGITPILCVGDKLGDRQEGMAKTAVNDQLTTDLGLLTAAEIGRIVIAYEPVWAISGGDGQGTNASPQDAELMIKLILESIAELYGKTVASKIKLLYGGSVNTHNSKSLLKIEDLDGFLVGGESLNYQHFAQVIKDTQEFLIGQPKNK